MVSAQHIEKSYKNNQALYDISFSVDRGEIFGFVGPDGAGKTSLFRILTSLLLPDKGRATVNGFDVVKDFRKLRSIIGYMPGQFSLYSDLTVEENLKFFATVFGTTIQANYHLIKDIYSQIEPFKTRLAGRLSGGMKQKLALSCALIHQPVLLVLDEPTTGVDAVSRFEFWELLRGLKNKGITILVSTPYMDEAGKCDKIALIQNGRILSINEPKAIERTYGKKLYAIRSSNMYQLLIDLKEYPSAHSVFLFGQNIHFTDRDVPDVKEIQDYLVQKGHSEIILEPIDPGIEDVFMKLMEKDVKEAAHEQ
jgi:ABC-type multidrug transport system ATPase subunit